MRAGCDRVEVLASVSKSSDLESLPKRSRTFIRMGCPTYESLPEKRGAKEDPLPTNAAQEQSHESRTPNQVDQFPQPMRDFGSQNTSSAPSAIFWPSDDDFQQDFDDLSAFSAELNKCPYAFGEDSQFEITVRLFVLRITHTTTAKHGFNLGSWKALLLLL